jgi:hypothetical protein
MPDYTGALSEPDNQKIQDWWTQHWKSPVICPVCKTSEWTVAPHVVNIQRYAMDAAAANTVSYPHIAVTCKKCAHSMFFNAVQIGISPPGPAPGLPIAGLLGSPLSNTGIFGALAPVGALSVPPPEGILGSLMKKDK